MTWPVFVPQLFLRVYNDGRIEYQAAEKRSMPLKMAKLDSTTLGRLRIIIDSKALADSQSVYATKYRVLDASMKVCVSYRPDGTQSRQISIMNYAPDHPDARDYYASSLVELLSLVEEIRPSNNYERKYGYDNLRFYWLTSKQEELRLQQASDRFIKRFRKSLDFGLVFEKEFAKGSIRRLRQIGFFEQMNIKSELVATLQDAELERVYKAFMNFYYLRGFYEVGVGVDEMPSDIATEIQASSFSNLLSDRGNGEQVITTRKEFDEFTKILSKVAALYRARLPSNVFNSSPYNDNVKRLFKLEGRVRIRNDYEDFGVEKGTNIYQLDKDIFTFFFIVEKGQFKVVFLGMGD